MTWALRFRRLPVRRSKFTLHFVQLFAQYGFLHQHPLDGPHRGCNCRGSTIEAPRDGGCSLTGLSINALFYQNLLRRSF